MTPAAIRLVERGDDEDRVSMPPGRDLAKCHGPFKPGQEPAVIKQRLLIAELPAVDPGWPATVDRDR
jgi:hypothetical protein